MGTADWSPLNATGLNEFMQRQATTYVHYKPETRLESLRRRLNENDQMIAYHTKERDRLTAELAAEEYRVANKDRVEEQLTAEYGPPVAGAPS